MNMNKDNIIILVHDMIYNIKIIYLKSWFMITNKSVITILHSAVVHILLPKAGLVLSERGGGGRGHWWSIARGGKIISDRMNEKLNFAL